MLVAACIGNDHRMYVAWVKDTGAWNGPAPIGDPVAPPGAAVTIATIENGIAALVVGDDRRLHVAWVTGTGNWNGPVPFGEPFAPPGADLASEGPQVAVMGEDHKPYFAYAGANNGPWQGPFPIGPVLAAPGSAVCLALQLDASAPATRLDLLVEDTNGAINFLWNGVTHSQDGWSAPIQIRPSALVSVIERAGVASRAGAAQLRPGLQQSVKRP